MLLGYVRGPDGDEWLAAAGAIIAVVAFVALIVLILRASDRGPRS